MAGKRIELSGDMTLEEAQAALGAMLAGEEPTDTADSDPQAPEATDFDGGAREPLRPPSDAQAEHNRLVLNLVRGAAARRGEFQ